MRNNKSPLSLDLEDHNEMINSWLVLSKAETVEELDDVGDECVQVDAVGSHIEVFEGGSAAHQGEDKCEAAQSCHLHKLHPGDLNHLK